MQYKMEFKTSAMAILAATFLIREKKFFSYLYHNGRHIIGTSEPMDRSITELINAE